MREKLYWGMGGGGGLDSFTFFSQMFFLLTCLKHEYLYNYARTADSIA